METKLIACATLKNELTWLFRKHDIHFETIWIESGLHSRPELLHERLQQELDKIRDCDRLLAAFGNCGNALTNLHKGDFQMIVPKVDDCISLFFGSDAVRNAYGREHAAIYMTMGWLEGESNIVSEYTRMLDRYGKKRADSILRKMYAHYRELALLDSGVTAVEDLLRATDEVEEIMGLKRAVVPVNLNYLEKLLLGPWTEEEFHIW